MTQKNQYELELGNLVISAEKHIKAIEVQRVKDLVLSLIKEFRSSIEAGDVTKIREQKSKIIDVCKKEGIDLPAGVEDSEVKIETNETNYHVKVPEYSTAADY